VHRRANRAAIFAAVVGAHLLALHLLPDFRAPSEVSDRELSLPITIYRTGPQHARTAISRGRPPARGRKRTPHEGTRETVSPAASAPQPARGSRPWIDWEKESDAAVAHRGELASEAERRASALSRWREHVMPGSPPPRPQFRWDYAATHRLETTPGGLVINVSDRCFIVTNGLMVLPVCRIGKIPAYGDLFADMDDPKEPGDSSVP
jgi:hypothetical protein